MITILVNGIKELNTKIDTLKETMVLLEFKS